MYKSLLMYMCVCWCRNLELKNFVLAPGDKDSYQYDLLGVVNHYGGLGGGHCKLTDSCLLFLCPNYLVLGGGRGAYRFALVKISIAQGLSHIHLKVSDRVKYLMLWNLVVVVVSGKFWSVLAWLCVCDLAVSDCSNAETLPKHGKPLPAKCSLNNILF